MDYKNLPIYSLLTASLLCLAACDNPEASNVEQSQSAHSIDNFSKEEVIANNGNSFEKLFYQERKADWITLLPEKVKFSHTAILNTLGFEKATPDLLNNFAIHWEHIPEILEVAAFPGDDGNVRYFYTKVSSKP